MSINYHSLVIGEVRADQVSAVPGIGASLLRFTLRWSLHPKKDEHVYSVFATFLRISAAPEGSSDFLFLGHATPETAWCEESRSGIPSDLPLMYLLSLPADQLLALEHMRRGRGLTFSIDVRGNAHGPYGIRQIYEALRLNVPVSEWIRTLRDAQSEDVLLVGVSLPVASRTRAVAASIELVRRAHEHLLRGEYDSSVGECRRALESVWKAGKLDEPARSARKALATMEERKSMSKRERQLALGEAVKNFTQPAHHVDGGGDPEIFSRLDATVAVASTAALVSSLAAAVKKDD